MSESNGRPIIDAHAHFFGVRYALLEVLAWMFQAGRGKLQGVAPAGRRDDPLADFVRYVVDLLAAALGNCRENYDREINQYVTPLAGAQDPRPPLWTVPLMMDIFYMCDPGPPCGSPLKADGLGKQTDLLCNVPKLVDNGLETLRERVMEEVRLRPNANGLGAAAKTALAELADEQAKEQDAVDALRGRADKRPGDVFLTPGYACHMAELIELHEQTRHGDNRVLPFLALDPRRPGALKLLTERHLVTANGPFYGVKLYPALGYRPTHPELYSLYKHCVAGDYKIPITAHCLDGGLYCTFLSEVNDRYIDGDGNCVCRRVTFPDASMIPAYFGHPSQWRQVLCEFGGQGLRVNLAHFGGDIAGYCRSGASTWPGEIVRLMERYEGNLFADTAYFATDGSVEALDQAMEQLLPQPAKDHLMFGTDYVMIVLEPKCGGVEEYFARFGRQDHLPPEMFNKNAAKFLQLPD